MESCVGPKQKVMVAPLTEEELDAITVVFHQYETGLREGTIYTKVRKEDNIRVVIEKTVFIKFTISTFIFYNLSIWL